MTEKPTEFAVGEREGNIIVQFDKPVDHLAMDEETARAFGEKLCKQAYTTKYGSAPDSRSLVSQIMRDKLVTRAAHLIRNLTDRKVLPAKIAVEVVDIILSEVT